ncbi:MAG: glycoside hydrolase family 5 protein [Bacteroides sp.]|nr:glycoside hydrolase family 5 protein [Bacteroides sp.]
MICLILLTVMTLAGCNHLADPLSDGETGAAPEAVASGVTTRAANFSFRLGVNISNWLSQSTLTGSAREYAFQQYEISNLASWGFDHIRIPVDEEHLFLESGAINREVADLLHRTLGWCEAAGIKVILDLHIIRSHNFDHAVNTLWYDSWEQDYYMNMWHAISAEFRGYSNDLLAYELLNEPVAPEDAMWNTLSARVIRELRVHKPERVLIVGANMWNGAYKIPALTVPAGDPNLILSFHFYEPYLLTHYKAEWNDFQYIDVNLNYPGQLISDQEFYALPQWQQDVVGGYFTYYDKYVLLGQMQAAIDHANALGVRLHCGEFGCYRLTYSQVKYNWVYDMVSLFRERNIPHTYWEYKAGFGFCNADGSVADYGVLDLLTK